MELTEPRRGGQNEGVRQLSGGEMQATMILADAATGHPDNTFSLLRGGIDKVHVPRNAPPNFRGALVVQVAAEPSEYGDHNLKLDCLTDQGEPVAQPIASPFTVRKGGGKVLVVLSFQMALPRLGKYEFSLVVDGHQLGRQGFELVERATKPGEPGGEQ